MEYKLSKIAEICGGELHGEDRIVCDICTDSRGSLGQCALFVAMSGKNHDSHSYIPQMQSRGVDSFLVEHSDFERGDGDISYVVVESSIDALQRLATDHRNRFKGVVIGITGSNGKTTIKEWIAQLAPDGVKIFRSPRSYNSQLGVALSLLMIEGDEDFAIIEAGISRPNEMERLERMIAPDIAIITSIGEAHQEGFESLQQKIEEKMVLARSASKVIYHSEYSELIPHIIYGATECIDAANAPKAMVQGEASQRNSQIVNTLFHTLGFAPARFDSINTLAMRLEIIEGLNHSLIINDSYNSDINSLTIALDTLRSNASGRATTIIMSDILESGRSSEELYRRVAMALERANIDTLIGIGSEISKCADLFSCQCRFYTSTEELLRDIKTEDYAGRAILLKGNRESRFEKIGHKLAYKSHTTTLEVNIDAMIENLNHYRQHLANDTKLVAMVKANSYGAGGVEIAQILQNQGVDYLAVAFADEGSELREGGVTMPIIVLNADDGSFAQMVDSRLEPEIYSIRSLRNFAEAVTSHSERNYPIHIKLDTGMHRLGFMEEDIVELGEQIHKLRGVVKVASIFSHLATSDMGEAGREQTEAQIARFDTMSSAIQEILGYRALRHIANSAAIVAYPSAHFDMCRLGIGLYGFGEESLRPISTLKSRIVQIRSVDTGESIGYGAAESVKKESLIATIPIGYADGLNRKLGEGIWSVIIGGKSAPIVGRICMDSCMVNITDIEGVEEGDEVVILSPTAGNRASDMAECLGTIPYEVLTSISSRVKRVYLKE